MRLFTVDEVNALIPRMEFLVERMQRGAAELRRRIAEAAAAAGRPPDGVSVERLVREQPDCLALLEEIEALRLEIEATGGEFKGIDVGLVDFPAEIEGEVGLLCWQFGEKEVAFWHTMTGGFAGRRPLPAARRKVYLQ